MVRNFKFPDSWDVRYPDEGQTAANAPARYITLFWDFFSAGIFRFPVTKFFLKILSYYKFHISQMQPIGMVQVRYFEFVCQSMHIEPTVTRFRAGVIPMKMVFRGKEDVVPETIHTPFSENWNQDLKDVSSIALPEKALVGVDMSHCWRMNREDKLVYTEDGKGGKMTTVPKRADEELCIFILLRILFFHEMKICLRNPQLALVILLWFLLKLQYYFLLLLCVRYHCKVLLFPVGELSNLGIGPKKKKRVPAAGAAPKKNDAMKAQSPRAKNVKGEKKGTRHSSDSWCDYVAVSNSLEELALVVVKKPKAEPRDTTDIPPSNPGDPIDLESSPEPLLKTKAGKRKQTDAEAEGQPAKKVQRKKITRRANLDAFIAKPPPEKPSSPVHAETSFTVNEDLLPSPPRAPISEQLESTKAAGEDEVENSVEAWNPEVEKPVEVAVETEKVVVSETAEVESARLKSPEVMVRDAEKGKFVPEDPVITNLVSAPTPAPVNIERNPAGDQGASSYDDENDPLRPDETLGDHYYRTYTERKASILQFGI
ncbi:hypothetical protein Hdeb2414_s0005g00161971 [Helianthus debilis subsp. tardiflorus]